MTDYAAQSGLFPAYEFVENIKTSDTPREESALTQQLWSQLTGGAILPPKPTAPDRVKAFAHFRSALPDSINEATAAEAFNVAWHAGFDAGSQEVRS